MSDATKIVLGIVVVTAAIALWLGLVVTMG